MGFSSGNWAEGVPFATMVAMEGSTIALTILAKTALTGGLSPFVFIVYTNALGSLLLLPYSFFFHKERRDEPFFTFPLLARCFILGLIGVFFAQNLSFIGLRYSSPIVVCVMGLQIPTFSFLLSLILRKTKLDWNNSSIKTRIIGCLISITGALVVEGYKGPFIRPASIPHSNINVLQHTKPQLFVYYSTPDNWVVGCLYLAGAALSVSIWNIIQLDTVKKYPEVMKVVSFYSIAGTIQCGIFSFFMVSDLNAWKLKLNLDLLLIIVTAIFGSIVRTNVHLFLGRTRGPFYVPLFKPFGIFFAALFGIGFFTNSLHYGSVIGAVIGGVGYYTVMWGQLKENEMSKENNDESNEIKAPLLQEEEDVERGSP